MNSIIPFINFNKSSSIEAFTIPIPKEVLSLICRHFTLKEVANLALTNRCLSVHIFLDDPLWGSLLKKYFPNSCANFNPEIENLAVYKYLTNAVHNIKNKEYHFQAFDERMNFAHVTVYKGKLIFSSSNHEIKIIDIKTRKELQTLRGHQKYITCLTVYDNKWLISGSYDNSIKIWDLETGAELQTLCGHQKSVDCLAIYDKWLISGSFDKTIRIWDLNAGKEIEQIKVKNTISSLAIYEDKLIFNSYKKIKIWDLNLGKEIKTLKHSTFVECLAVHQDKLISGSDGGEILIWDLKSEQPPRRLGWHRTVKCIIVHDGLIFSGGGCGKIKIWDLNTGPLLILKESKWEGCINSLVGHSGKLIAHSTDKKIKIWDFNYSSLTLPARVLEKNLQILESMLQAESIGQPIEELANKLHPDFKRSLGKHCLKLGEFFPNSSTAILRVRTEVYIEALLDAIHSEDPDRVSSIIDCLISLDSKNVEIYELLGEIQGKANFDGWKEDVFSNRQEYFSFLFQKEEAVIKFKQILEARWNEGLPFLSDLGIFTKEDYSQKLKCSPDHLFKIGICSSADLRALGLFNSPKFEHLQMITPENVTKDLTEDLYGPERRAFKKKEGIDLFLNGLLDAAGEKFREAEHKALFFETGNIWIAFQRELQAVQAGLDAQCDGPKGLLATFDTTSYTEIVKRMNALIDQFDRLNREHQIAKLSAYVNQYGIFKVWDEEYHLEGFKSLAALLEQKKDINPFQMGK